MLGMATVSLILLVGAAAAPVEAGPCLDRLLAQIEDCNGFDHWFVRQLCYFEAGLEFEACLARHFR